MNVVHPTWPRPNVAPEERIRELERQLRIAADRIAALEAEIGADIEAPPSLGLTRAESRLFGVILKRPIATYSLLYEVAYGARPENSQPDSNVLSVLMTRMRPKLRALGIEIETIYGTGYRMSAESKARAQALLEQADVSRETAVSR